MANEVTNNAMNYGDDNIRTLEGVEHIRLRPGMYIGFDSSEKVLRE